jgi:uncharacterized membrane protein YkoI
MITRYGRFMRASVLPALLVLSLAHASAARADDNDEETHDAIRAAVDRGEAKPLAQLRRMVLEKVTGEIVSVKLDRESRQLIYEFRVLRGDGRILEVEVQAATGEILEIEND